MKHIIFLFSLFIITFGNSYSQNLIDYGGLTGNRYYLGESKWNNTVLRYYIFNSATHLTYYERESAIQNAFNTWSSMSIIQFIQVNTPEDADLLIKWETGEHGDGNPFDGQGNVLAHAFYPPPSGGSFAGHLHFDDDENWTVNGYGTDLESVALHEIGHLIGIGHSEYFNAVMYPSYWGIKRMLDDDDILAAMNLYPPIISGPFNPIGTNVYSIQGLPNGYTVAWQFSHGSGATSGWTLQQNNPQNNQCTFTYTTRVAMSGTLTAQIFDSNCNLVKTITKALSYTPAYIGTYSLFDNLHVIPHHIPATGFYDGGHLAVFPKCDITIQFASWTVANINHWGNNLLAWTDDGQGTIVLRFPYSSTQWQYQTVTGNILGQSFEFYIDCQPDNGPIIGPTFDLAYSGGSLTITIIENDEQSQEAQQSMGNSSDIKTPWHITIANAITGEIMLSSRSDGAAKEVSTYGWAKGMYIIKGQNDDYTLTEKIIIN